MGTVNSYLNKICSCLSTWVFSGIWCSSDRVPWHTAVEPGNLAESILAFSVAATKAGLQRVDGCWPSALMPCQSHLGGHLICHSGLKRCLLRCFLIRLSSLSVVTLEWPILGRFLMFPVYTWGLDDSTSPLVIPKQAAIAGEDCPVSAAPTVCHLISSLSLHLAMFEARANWWPKLVVFQSKSFQVF